ITDQRLEVFRPRHEVRLAVDLDQHPDLAAHVDVAADRTLARFPARTLRRLRGALRAQEVDRLLHVPARLLQRLLALHHPGAGPLTQLLYLLSSDRHLFAPLSSSGPGRCITPWPLLPTRSTGLAHAHSRKSAAGLPGCSAAALSRAVPSAENVLTDGLRFLALGVAVVGRPQGRNRLRARATPAPRTTTRTAFLFLRRHPRLRRVRHRFRLGSTTTHLRRQLPPRLLDRV